jgi:NADH-quinone oxidoreductase subunit J
MLLGAERLRNETTLPYQRPAAIILTVILIAMAIYALLLRSPAASSTGAAQPLPGFGDPAALALILFNEYLLPFEVTSILLLVAMIGAIVLTHGHIRKARP